MEFMRLAGGLIAIMIAIGVVPAYRKCRKEPGEALIKHGGTGMQLLIMLAYVLMAVGNVVPV